MHEIIKIAKKVRKKLEKMLVEYEPEDWYDDLCGACCVGTYLLLRELEKRKINAYAAISRNHVFLIYRNKIIDVTATQFGFLENVLVKNLNSVSFMDTQWVIYDKTNNSKQLKEKWAKMGCSVKSRQHPQSWIDEGLI